MSTVAVFGDGSGRRRSRLSFVLVVALLLVGLTVSLVVAVTMTRSQSRYATETMDEYAHDVTADLTGRIDAYSNTLSDLAASIGAQSQLSESDFARITDGLNPIRLPGATGVSYVVPAVTTEVPAVQAAWRAEGDAGLRLRPLAGATDHEFVIFSRVFDGGESPVGTDLSHDRAGAANLDVARMTAGLAASAGRVLPQDRDLPLAQRQNSVMLAAPVYRALGTNAEDFQGWVVLDIRATDFLAEVLSTHPQAAVRVAMDDGNASRTLLAGISPTAPVLADDSLMRENSFVNSQRTWFVTAYPTTSMFGASERWMVALAAGGAALISLLLAAMTAVLLGSRNRALEQVERATADLREDIGKRKAVEIQLREREEQLLHLALHDPLTGLANRTLFYERVALALQAYARGGAAFAVFYIDLDGFKPVNDRYGHAVGDTVLRTVAARLGDELRPDDTAARFGGDEFAVLVEGLSEPAEVQPAAERIVTRIEQPIDAGSGIVSVTVTASLGAALSRPGDSVDDIVREADLAMYHAKTGGKARYVLANTGPGSR